MSSRGLEVVEEAFPVRGAFVIARGSRTEARVLTVTVRGDGGARGRGECVPYLRYGETIASVTEQIRSVAPAVSAGADRSELLQLLPAGAARNAVDAALWDLEAELARADGGDLPELRDLRPVRTVFTLSLGSPESMAEEARGTGSAFATLKLKLGGEPGDLDLRRVSAVREAAPDAELVVDANESWPAEEVERRIQELGHLGVSLIEQPMAAEEDAVLATFEHAVPLCADESFHTTTDLDRIADRYEVVNLKLDKTGGLTHALEAREAARSRGLGVMVGCMLGTSLAMAPALVLAQDADLVDLDGPYLLAEDRDPPLELSADGWIGPNRECWG